MEKPAALRLIQGPEGTTGLSDDFGIGNLSSVRARTSSEVGAAMVHKLNGPMTALMLYIGVIHENRERICVSDRESEWLKRLIDNAFREAERICNLIHHMGDCFEAPIPKEEAIPVARDAIAWWSRTGTPDSRSSLGADSPAGETNPSAATPLTPRERQVLRLVGEGCSNKEGAKLMNISYRTFECHRAQVMRKLGAKNAVELVRMMMLRGNAPSGSAEAGR
ncbi:helix-turn-helix transcriptional regulator [Bradyrhizobium ontarionense]|uniref:Helix-turn-helix transcriptional regulator n=1 Tax=Bradyrhizobium ontarionense TaxID=2898149 RepID=A0ABY3RMX2_9BRAD|nr:helix-turn-helix transcriptional regulator [Bradyrhizobium sp. A19]UFZ08387.1 helix-turn-helix transcriptional regulator [Bradyrhizobium sp. A19]